MIAHPLLFEPILVPKIWGGRTLERLFGRSLPPGVRIGESWEVSDMPEGVTTVAVGPAAGRSLRDIVGELGRRLLGGAPLADGCFPLLVKLLDAKDVLSVQVHPDERACEQMGGNCRVKHEAWYVMEAGERALIYAGLRAGVTRTDFDKALAAGTVRELLQPIPVRPGDCYYLPSGTLHALGPGILAAEVQTPSDTTFRVFDWNRPGDDGRPRPLHIEQALKCIHFGEPPLVQPRKEHVSDPWTTRSRLVTCPRFVMDKVRAAEGFQRPLEPGEMQVWIVLEGRGGFTTNGVSTPFEFQPGQTWVIPAIPDDTIVSIETDSAWLQITVPV